MDLADPPEPECKHVTSPGNIQQALWMPLSPAMFDRVSLCSVMLKIAVYCDTFPTPTRVDFCPGGVNAANTEGTMIACLISDFENEYEAD